MLFYNHGHIALDLLQSVPTGVIFGCKEEIYAQHLQHIAEGTIFRSMKICAEWPEYKLDVFTVKDNFQLIQTDQFTGVRFLRLKPSTIRKIMRA